MGIKIELPFLNLRHYMTVGHSLHIMTDLSITWEKPWVSIEHDAGWAPEPVKRKYLSPGIKP
jgi:hypothetical protein